MLTVEGARHTVAQDGVSPCVNEAFVNYLVNLEVPAEDRRCTL